jgi:ATP-binding cassette subfamily B protein
VKKIKHILHSLLFIWESGPRWTIARIALLFVQATLPLLSLYFYKLLIDTLTAGVAAPEKATVLKHLALLLGLNFLVSLVITLCSSLASIVNEIQTQVVIDHTYDILHSKAIEMDLEYYENSEYYDTLHRAQQEASNRIPQILNRLIQIGQNVISLLVVAGLLFFFNWGLAAILFASAIPRVLVNLKHSGKIYNWKHKRTSTERRVQYFSEIITSNLHAKEIRLFDLGLLFKRWFRDLRLQLRRERLALAIRKSLADTATNISTLLALLGSYSWVAYQTVQGIISLGDFVFYNEGFQRGYNSFWNILSGMANLYEDSLFIQNLYEFLDLKIKVVEPLHPQPVPQPMQIGIVFNHVGFHYSNSSQKSLEDITLTIHPREVVALVGENGAGKTTLIKLLCRLYDPTAGSITLDGIDLRQFATKDLRRQISVIFQDYVKYHLTARENIWVGNVYCPPDSAKIMEAARHAGADEVITKLPQNYETILGKQFEGGEELSIGEWQKVAIARAFFRDSQLIILDEPTSALDAKAEYEVFQKFRQLLKYQAAILISHRLSTVRMADRIYVLERGKIVESGSHDELVQFGGTYAQLFETQAKNYR